PKALLVKTKTKLAIIIANKFLFNIFIFSLFVFQNFRRISHAQTFRRKFFSKSRSIFHFFSKKISCKLLCKKRLSVTSMEDFEEKKEILQSFKKTR
ncbi:MAG TPA: hypothetical protein PKY82_24560, partial [Pyrinomonadaceae bacterium]|nr:hypothetical protein [Pyrinomonadaceae bacterium]